MEGQGTARATLLLVYPPEQEAGALLPYLWFKQAFKTSSCRSCYSQLPQVPRVLKGVTCSQDSQLLLSQHLCTLGIDMMAGGPSCYLGAPTRSHEALAYQKAGLTTPHQKREATGASAAVY